MLYRSLPLGVVVRIRGNIYRYALLIQCNARKRHVAFPADEAADRAPRRFRHGEIVLIRVTPNDALGSCGLELSVDLIRAVGLEDDVAVIKRSDNGVAL